METNVLKATKILRQTEKQAESERNSEIVVYSWSDKRKLLQQLETKDEWAKMDGKKSFAKKLSEWGKSKYWHNLLMVATEFQHHCTDEVENQKRSVLLELQPANMGISKLRITRQNDQFGRLVITLF